jgi:hypothetical protein
MSKTADALPDNADQDTFSTVPIPLRERRRDWFFVAMFAIFASTSFLTDPSPCWVVRTQTRGGSCHASSTTPGPIH